MKISDWLIFAGIVLTLLTGFAIPAAVWMAKMYTQQRVLMAKVSMNAKRVQRLERARDTQQLTTATSIQRSHAALAELLGSLTDRINEHASTIAGHEARITNLEGDSKEIRSRQHAFANILHGRPEVTGMPPGDTR